MAKEDERVLVVGRQQVFQGGTWLGINPDASDRVFNLASTQGEFRKRGDVEEDPSIKQIIPYIVFKHGDRYLLMQRIDTHDEQRLANLYSCGIGGHLREQDLGQGEGILRLGETGIYRRSRLWWQS